MPLWCRSIDALLYNLKVMMTIQLRLLATHESLSFVLLRFPNLPVSYYIFFFLTPVPSHLAFIHFVVCVLSLYQIFDVWSDVSLPVPCLFPLLALWLLLDAFLLSGSSQCKKRHFTRHNTQYRGKPSASTTTTTTTTAATTILIRGSSLLLLYYITI